jgi:hypothetical protein
MSATSKFAIELLDLYKPFPAWQDKLFLSDLVNRAVDMDQSLPGTAKASRTQTAAYFEYACEIKSFVKEFAQSIGIDVDATITVEDETIALYDFSCIDYDAFETRVGELEALIAQQMPDLNTVVPSLVAGMGSVDLARTLIAKLLAIFGLSEVLPAFWEVLEQGWGNILKELGEAIQARDWRRVRRLRRSCSTSSSRRSFSTGSSSVSARSSPRRLWARSLHTLFLSWDGSC